MPLLSRVEKYYPTLIVGGGIVGAGIFRDLSLHGISCLLIDKKDFSSQTSQSSSKILHGGIRYLENMDFGLVREASREKKHWITRAPHLCHERPFYLPVFRDSLRPLWKVRMGLSLYRTFSGEENPGSSFMGVEEVLEHVPHLRREGLRGAGIYYDAVVDDVKLTLEVIYDGLFEHCGEAINYVELKDLERGEKGTYRAFLRDTLTGEEGMVEAAHIIFATGPFTDQLLPSLKAINWRPKLLPSQGIHLWLEREALPLKHPVLLTPKDGRVLFAIPKGDKILVGTTETVPEKNFFDIRASEEDIRYLLENIRQFFPGSSVARDMVADTFGGVRPLVKGDTENRHTTERQHKIFRPHRNVYVVLGGKYTTFRIMGQEISRDICLKSRISYNSELSKNALRRRSVVSTSSSFSLTREHIRKIVKTEKVRTLEDLIKRRLGIPNRRFWREKVSFEDFFIPLMPELRQYLAPSSLDLSQF